MLSFKPWSESDIQDFLSRQSHSTFSYDAVRSTAGSPPLHYNLDRTHIRLGEGARTWELAVNAVRAWQMFNVPWMKLCWPSAPIRPGTDVAVIVRHFGFWSLNACRIVYVVEDESPERLLYGFAYGTLAQHAVQGEERFTVEWIREDDAVWYEIRAFSRPRELLAKLGYPLCRTLQRRFAAASNAAMLSAVSVR